LLRAALIAAAVLLSIDPAIAADGPPNNAASGHYYRLDPFVVPIMTRDAVARNLTIVVTLELKNDDKRDDVREKMPRLRHALNTTLLQLVAVQRADNSLPPIASMKRRMLDVTREVTGPDVVRDVLMESVYERRLR
jgi:flagellar basal body-associated protein FliL